MKPAAISLAILLAAATRAQTVNAGARAVVSADTLPVYTAMSESGGPKTTLKRGDKVVIGMVLFGSDTTWCAVSREGEAKRLGYASCESLERERTPAPEAPAPAQAPVEPPVKPAPKPAPVKAREMPPAPAAVHEPAPKPNPAPAPALIREPAPKALPTPALPAPAAPATPPPPPESGAPRPSKDFIDTVLDDTGLRAEITDYAQAARPDAFLDKGRLAEIDAAALDRVLRKRLQAGAILEAIAAQLRRSYSAPRMASLAEWLRSPAAGKLGSLERRAYAPASRQDLVEFAGTLAKSPPPEARLLLIHRIYNAMRTCDMEVETTIALVYTTAQAIDPALPKEKRYSTSELDRAMGGVKSRYRAVMKNARIVRYLFAFQSASDAELEQYAAFFESDTGIWLIAAVDKGFLGAAESISQRLREDIPRLVKARRN